MKITGAQIQLYAAHTLRKDHSVSETLGARGRIGAAPGSPSPAILAVAGRDTVRVSAQARQLATASEMTPRAAEASTPSAAQLPSDMVKLRVAVSIIEKLTGHKIKAISLRELADTVQATGSGRSDAASVQGANGEPFPAAASPSGIAGLVYERTETRYEHEHLTFRASGTVETANGEQIEFQIEISMQRELLVRQSVLVMGGEAETQDPLVVNFARSAVALADGAARVDLNGDGAPNHLPWLAAGSGYLVIDQDGDGRITSGSELFGPVSGDGFTELAAYDDDGNEWIDAGDAVFARLRLWHRDQAGAEQLSTLTECGIGAIWLRSVTTPFELPGEHDQTAGLLRATGLFLGANGRVGTVQQFDVVL